MTRKKTKTSSPRRPQPTRKALAQIIDARWRKESFSFTGDGREWLGEPTPDDEGWLWALAWGRYRREWVLSAGFRKSGRTIAQFLIWYWDWQLLLIAGVRIANEFEFKLPMQGKEEKS